MSAAPPDAPGSDAVFVRRVLIVIGLVALAALLWVVRDALLLAFAAVLVAALLLALADGIAHVTRLPHGWALGAAVSVVIAVLAGAGYAFGAEVAGQVRQLSDTLPAAASVAMERLEDSWLGPRVQQMLESAAPGAQAMLGWLQAATTGLGGAMANLFLVVVGGLYIATNPRLYRTGLLKLVPAERRELTGTALRDTGRSLRLWLVGQLVSMVLVGTLTGVGLWLIGVPSALVLGLLAGLLEFVPLVGPIVAAIPGLLIAATQGTETLLWALALYFVLQQLEGNIIQPLVQQRAVSLPPALLLFALVAFGTLFGIAGLLLAAPLTVVLFVAVKRLYVREALGTPTPIPGEEK